MAALAVSLLLALTLAYAFLWPRAAWYLVPAADRPLTQRALGDAAAIFGTTPEDYRWRARPTVTRVPGRQCVGLGFRRSGAHRRGGYWVCYDDRTGEILSERSSL